MSKEKLDIYGRQHILFDLLSKFGERGFDLFEKACAIIEESSELEASCSETEIKPDNQD